MNPLDPHHEDLHTRAARILNAMDDTPIPAIDATFYAGGETFADGVGGDTRQENSRLGATLSLPLKRGHTIKLLVAKGVTARVGSSFETYSIAYQFLWFD